MKISYNKKFLKDLASIPKKDRNKIAFFAFEEVVHLENSSLLLKLEKLSGFIHYYKIRFGNYRIGIKLIAEEITFERVLHRKEIYKMFP